MTTPRPAVSASEPLTFDVLILGGGVIGLASARSLHQTNPSLRIAVLDAPAKAMPASQAAAGMLAPFAEIADDTPLGRLCAQSLSLYTGFVEELRAETGEPVTLQCEGTLIPETEREAERFEKRLSAYRRRGLSFQVLSGGELRDAEPVLAPDIFRAVRLPEALINPRELHTALKASAQRSCITWIEGRAVSRTNDGGRIQSLTLEDGRRVSFNTLIAATGAWTGAVAELLDLRFDVRPVKGQMLMIGAPEGLLNHVVHLKALYLAPRRGHGIIVGSTMEDRGFDTTVEQAVVDDFHRQAAELVPALGDCDVIETWAGHRPKAPDGNPIIGWASRWKNVLVATGHFRNGILLTPLTGRIVAALFENPERDEWAAFSPDRFAVKA